jgi:hypothetical protein
LGVFRVRKILTLIVLTILTAFIFSGCSEEVEETTTSDNTSPSVTITTSAAVLQGKTNANPIPVTVTFSEAVTGFVIGGVVVGSGTPGVLSGSGTTYTFDVTPIGDPTTVTVDIAAGVAQDAALNGNTTAAQLSLGFDFTFDPTNGPPLISDITDKITNQDTLLEFILFTADEGVAPAEDIESLAFVSATSSVQSLVPDANITLTSFTDNGALDGASGELSILPALGQIGSTVITVTVQDANGSAVSDTFVLTVNATVDPPVAYPVSASTGQDIAVAVTLFADDPFGEAITSWTIDLAPSNGTLSGTAPNLTYTPDLGYSGRDSFTYFATDASGYNSNMAIVTLIINGNADLIVADPFALNVGEATVYAEIQALGFQVTLVDDNDIVGLLYTAADAEAVDLLLISSSTPSANVGDIFRNITTPVLTWERFLYDTTAGGFGMTGTTGTGLLGDDDGTVTTDTITIVDSAHPLSGGLANGAYTVFTGLEALVWAEVSADAEIVATVFDPLSGTDKPVLFVYEAGDLMQGGVLAPAKRVAYFLPDFGLGGLTADAITILHGAINEALAR